MPRIVEITAPTAKADSLLEEIRNLPEVISLRVEKGISVQPPGDVITVAVPTDFMPSLLSTLDRLGIPQSTSASVTTSRPLSLISPSAAELIRNDTSYSIWEEVDQTLNKESSMSPGAIVVMALAGAIAITGILTNALHLVIGAMVIAPGFEPITRIALGLVNRSRAWKSGVSDALKGYAALIAGAALTALVLQSMGYGPTETQSSYLPEGALLSYWTSITATSLLASTAAAGAGALLILQERSVLTAGVMIALSLVPAATLLGFGIAMTDPPLILTSLSRLATEVMIVAVVSLIAFGWKLRWVEKRKMSG